MALMLVQVLHQCLPRRAASGRRPLWTSTRLQQLRLQMLISLRLRYAPVAVAVEANVRARVLELALLLPRTLRLLWTLLPLPAPLPRLLRPRRRPRNGGLIRRQRRLGLRSSAGRC